MSTKKINKNIALIEYGGSHVECMYFQLFALRNNGYSVFLICNKSLVDRFPDTTLFEDILLLNDAGKDVPLKKKLSDILKIRKFIKKNNINSTVTNTLECRILTFLFLVPMANCKNNIGIIHYSKYIVKSSTFKWFYRRIKKIFFLSDHLLRNIGEIPQRLTISTFYPIYFPEYNDFPVEKPDGEFWVCTPGNAWQGNRDALSLIKDMHKTKLNGNVKILFLGGIDLPTKDEIDKLESTSNIFIYGAFMPQNVLDAYLKKSDVIIPLIHHDLDNRRYGEKRISGTYNLAYAYQKPMLLERQIKESNNDFDGISIPYELDSIVDTINYISNHREEYSKVLYAIQNHPYLNVKKQSEKYIELIEK